MRFAALLLLALPTCLVWGQGTSADYQRAQGLREKFQGLALNIPGPANWIDSTSRFWYRKSVRGGHEFVLVDANTLARDPAFDHAKLAASLSAISGEKYEPVTLPFSEFTFLDQQREIQFTSKGAAWKCRL